MNGSMNSSAVLVLKYTWSEHRLCNVAPVKPLSGADWLLTGSLQKMVLVISSVASKEVLERWTFDIQTDKATMDKG